MNKKILFVEDDKILSEKLTDILRSEGVSVTPAASLSSARNLMNSEFSLALIDWMLPDGEGIDLIQEWGKRFPQVPLLILSAKAQITAKVAGLHLGACDYVTKPFEPIELLARIHAHIRLSTRSSKEIEEPVPLKN